MSATPPDVLPAMELDSAGMRGRLVTHRPAGRLAAVVRSLGWLLITIGVFLLGFVVHQLWVTDFFAERAQAGLEDELAARSSLGADVVTYDPVTGRIGPDPVAAVTPDVVLGGAGAVAESVGGVGDPATTPTGISITPTDLFLLRDPQPAAGDPIGTIRIPDIGLVWTVVEGVRRPQLNKGAGHMPRTPLPGQPGNAVVSGHRTTYGAPFHNLDKLEEGDLIFWDSPTGTHTFQVSEDPVIVRPDELWVTDPRDGAWITLTTCHPKFSARQRLIIFAEMVDGPNFPVIYGQG